MERVNHETYRTPEVTFIVFTEPNGCFRILFADIFDNGPKYLEQADPIYISSEDFLEMLEKMPGITDSYLSYVRDVLDKDKRRQTYNPLM